MAVTILSSRPRTTPLKWDFSVYRQIIFPNPPSSPFRLIRRKAISSPGLMIYPGTSIGISTVA
jgi:hypothetical protein